jgi:transcriptional regulator with XRE-family HTH domain
MLDFARYDRERLRRGVTDAEVARVAGLAAITISRARHGKTQLRESTFAKLATALTRFPVVRGADALLSPDPAAPPP